MTFPPTKRHSQCVMCPEQDCESLVYMSDQSKSMIETLDIHEDPVWQERVEKFYGWFHKSSRTSKAAWTWEEGQDTSKWSGTRGSSKRHQSVPVNPKHVFKHQKPNERHRCTLCAGRHPPFLCSKAQIDGGDAKPNWYKIEYKRPKQDGREPDYRWGENVTHVDVDPPQQAPQCPAEDPQPQCATAAMMHGPSMAAASSWQGGCPTIAENQEWRPPMPS